MRAYALTYPQLMNQAQAMGCSASDLTQLRRAYELAEAAVDGYYRAQGMPFICHLVRTASIVLSERQPVEAAVAALLHAAYMLHRFGGNGTPTARQRRRLAGCIGGSAEALIRHYDELPWYTAEALRAHLASAGRCPLRTRQVLVMRLANELEDHLDRAMAYRGGYPYEARIASLGSAKVALAEALDCPQLAEELAAAFREHLERPLPAEVRRSQCHAYRLRRDPLAPLRKAARAAGRLARRIRPAPASTAGDTHD
jgi:hypothetical protein